MRRLPVAWLIPLALVLVALAWLRPLNHDESQYVAAALLVAHGELPYRDFAYLQTPLQPFVLAPLAGLASEWAWPALRLANALFGVVAVAAVAIAARAAGAARRPAMAAAALFAACDIVLFSVGTARNDAMPCALFAAALVPILRAERGGSRTSAMLAGLLLAAAAAAKISYALPAAAYGAFALIDRRHRPGWVALGAAPVIAAVALLAAWAPAAFWFGTVDFPARAPAEYYAATGRAWRLGLGARALDTVKFLALGPALLAIPLALRARAPRVSDVLLAACLVASLLPAPTWRQYLLPLLPVLFVRLALALHARPPGRVVRIALAVVVGAGLAPTIAALAQHDPAMPTALNATAAVTKALDAAGIGAGTVTLSPQFLGARLPDARFAAGPFYFRSSGLLTPAEETRFHLLSRARLEALGDPPALLTGAEGWPSGDPRLDAALDRWATAQGYRPTTLPGPLTLWIRPRAVASPPPPARNNP